MKRTLALRTVTLALSVSYFAPSYAQEQVSYSVSFDNAAHHEAEIVARFPGAVSDPLEVRMSVASPGRYARMHFARNVYNVRAFDGRGRELTITRPDPHQWNVAGHDGTVEVRYTLFGDQADGTFVGIDASHAHLNIPAAFAWARGMDDRAIAIEFEIPKGSGWKAATQLFPGPEPMTFTAPDLQYFMDSPVELSAHASRSWCAGGPGDTAYTLTMALHHDGTEPEADAYAAMSRRVVEEAAAVFGEYPAFDGGKYVFIADYLPWVSGDGMEHRNSTVITGREPLRTNAAGNVGTVAHEFLHVWNVERIRPKSLEPFDFEGTNTSSELWFAEGVTNYYERLVRMRAGSFGIDRFTEGLGSNLSALLNAPGPRYFSAEEMSRKAPLVDGAAHPDLSNDANTFFSYYSFGDAIGAALDLTLRSRFPGLSLDNFMRRVWQVHGRTEVPYTDANLETILAGLTNDPGFAHDFFSKYVAGRETADYARLLAPAGLLLRRKEEGKASIGAATLHYNDSGAVVGAGPSETSAIYRAGMDRGDTIVSIAGQKVTSKANLDSLLAKHKPDDRVDVEFIQRGSRRSGSLTLLEAQPYEVVTNEKAGIPVTESGREFRRNWLGSKASPAGPPPVRYCRNCKREYPFEYEYCHYDGNGLKITKE